MPYSHPSDTDPRAPRLRTFYVEVPMRGVQTYQVEAYSLVDAEREVKRFREAGAPDDESIRELDHRVTWSGAPRAVRP